LKDIYISTRGARYDASTGTSIAQFLNEKKSVQILPRPSQIYLTQRVLMLSRKSAIPDFYGIRVGALSVALRNSIRDRKTSRLLLLAANGIARAAIFKATKVDKDKQGGNVIPVKPALEAPFADGATENQPLGMLHFGSSCKSASPRFYELQARYAATHAIEQRNESDLQNSKTDSN